MCDLFRGRCKATESPANRKPLLQVFPSEVHFSLVWVGLVERVGFRPRQASSSRCSIKDLSNLLFAEDSTSRNRFPADFPELSSRRYSSSWIVISKGGFDVFPVVCVDGVLEHVPLGETFTEVDFPPVPRGSFSGGNSLVQTCRFSVVHKLLCNPGASRCTIADDWHIPKHTSASHTHHSGVLPVHCPVDAAAVATHTKLRHGIKITKQIRSRALIWTNFERQEGLPNVERIVRQCQRIEQILDQAV